MADDKFDSDTRFEAAERLAEVDEAQAAEALRSIVADDKFDPDTRSVGAARPGRGRWLTTKVDHNGIRPWSIEPDGGKPNPR